MKPLVLYEARTFISEVLTEEMHRMSRGEITFDEFCDVVNLFERYKFVPEHDTFFPTIIELAQEVNKSSKEWAIK